MNIKKLCLAKLYFARNESSPYSSSTRNEGWGRWPIPVSINSTFCQVYQDNFLLSVCNKELASTVDILPRLAHVPANRVCIFIFCRSLLTPLVRSWTLSLLIYPDVHSAFQILAVAFVSFITYVHTWKQNISTNIQHVKESGGHFQQKPIIMFHWQK